MIQKFWWDDNPKRSIKARKSFLAYTVPTGNFPTRSASFSIKKFTDRWKEALTPFSRIHPPFDRRSSPSPEIPNLCIMPPMIKYSPACKSKSRRENPTLYTHTHIYTYVHVRGRSSPPSEEAGQKRGRLVIKMQNSSAFNCMEYRNIRREVDIPGCLETRAEKPRVPSREISSKMACVVCLLAFQFTTSQRTFIPRFIFVETRQRGFFPLSFFFPKSKTE